MTDKGWDNLDLYIPSGGLVRYNGALYGDYLVPGFSIRTGANPPTLKVFRGNVQQFAFAGTGVTVEQGFFALHILHDIKVGTTPTFHVHWSHIIGAPSGNVKWQLEVTLAKGYGIQAFPAPTTISAVQAAGTQYYHHLTSDDSMPLPAALAAELEPDCILLGRVFRDPADAADTFADDAYLLQIDLHYQIGQSGTVERNRPFTSAGF